MGDEIEPLRVARVLDAFANPNELQTRVAARVGAGARSGSDGPSVSVDQRGGAMAAAAALGRARSHERRV